MAIINNAAKQTTNGVAATNSAGQVTSTQGYQAAQLGDPTKWNVDKDQTVQGQVQGIIAQNSPLMQQARGQAQQDMNARGLLNSAMATTAGESAVYSAAMPIATQDAATFAKAAGYNADMSNQFAVHNVDSQNQAAMFGADSANKAGLTNANNTTNTNISNAKNATDLSINQNTMDTQRWLGQLDANTRTNLGQLDANTRLSLGQLDANTRMQLGQLDANTRMQLGQLDASTRQSIAQMDNATKVQVTDLQGRYQQLLQTNQSAAAMFNQMAAQVSEIDRSSLDPQSKMYAINRQTINMQDALETMAKISSVPGLSGFYNGVNNSLAGTAK